MITVQQAIEELQKIENKSLPVYLETECFDKFYSVTSIVERKDFVEVCTCFEEKYYCDRCDREIVLQEENEELKQEILELKDYWENKE